MIAFAAYLFGRIYSCNIYKGWGCFWVGCGRSYPRGTSFLVQRWEIIVRCHDIAYTFGFCLNTRKWLVASRWFLHTKLQWGASVLLWNPCKWRDYFRFGELEAPSRATPFLELSYCNGLLGSLSVSELSTKELTFGRCCVHQFFGVQMRTRRTSEGEVRYACNRWEIRKILYRKKRKV